MGTTAPPCQGFIIEPPFISVHRLKIKFGQQTVFGSRVNLSPGWFFWDSCKCNGGRFLHHLPLISENFFLLAIVFDVDASKQDEKGIKDGEDRITSLLRLSPFPSLSSQGPAKYRLGTIAG